jgi:hypothetical protein
MPFGMPESERKTFKKTVFFTPELGSHYIRFLSPSQKASKTPQHYLAGSRTSVKCLGDECPICENNRILFAENPGKRFIEIKGLNLPSTYAHINILDKTPVKICPNADCGHEVKADMMGKFPTVCPYCISPQKQTLLVDVKPSPSGKVKVMSLSKTLAGQVDTQESGVLDAEGNPLPLTSYDYEIFVVPNGDKKSIVFKPHPEMNGVENVPEEMFFDTENSVLTLTRDEIISLMKGTQLRDIFAARKTADTKATESVEKVPLSQEEIQKKISELMAD